MLIIAKSTALYDVNNRDMYSSFIICCVNKNRLTMTVESNSKSMQYLFDIQPKGVLFLDNLENEIECPRCHDLMTLFSDFDFLYYKCQECHLPLYTSPNVDS